VAVDRPSGHLVARDLPLGPEILSRYIISRFEILIGLSGSACGLVVIAVNSPGRAPAGYLSDFRGRPPASPQGGWDWSKRDRGREALAQAS